MSFLLRTNEDIEKVLENFMSKAGHATKTKAIFWLIDNADRLIESDKKLNDIIAANERRLADEKLISKLLTGDV